MRTYFHLFGIAIVCLACGAEAEGRETPQTTGEIVAPRQGSETASQTEAEAEPEEPPTPEELEAAAVDLQNTVVDAIEAATLAETGSTYCESAFEGISAMIARVAEQYPEDTRPVPPQRAFMAVCERLSQDAQQCLVPSYATEHVAECGVIADAMPAEDRRRLEEVLTSQ